MKPNLLGVYKAVVTKEFITRRDRKAPEYNAGIRGADAEFPEYHQVQIDINQVLYEGWEYDTEHSILKKLDYKQYSQDGVHVSPAIQNQIRKGKVDNLIIWKWYPNAKYVQLKEGMQVSYEIIGIVDAKEALRKINSNNRFTFTCS